MAGRSIRLKSCFAIPGSDSDIFPLPENIKTMGDILGYIGGKIDFSFTDPESGGIEDDLEIIVNNKEIWFYPDALKTEIQDGDTVEIYLLPLGGG